MTMDNTKQIRQNGQKQRNEKHFNPNNLNLRYTLKIKVSKGDFHSNAMEEPFWVLQRILQ